MLAAAQKWGLNLDLQEDGAPGPRAGYSADASLGYNGDVMAQFTAYFIERNGGKGSERWNNMMAA